MDRGGVLGLVRFGGRTAVMYIKCNTASILAPEQQQNRTLIFDLDSTRAEKE